MAYSVENSLADLLNQIGTELHDLTLTESADGARVSKAWAARVLDTAAREVFRRLRKEKVDPLQFKEEFSPTVDASDSELYPFDTARTRQVLRVFDYISSTSEITYWPLSTYDIDDDGWVLEPRGLRLRNATVSGTLKIWAVQTPVRLSYGTATSAAATNIVLASSPDIGSTSAQPNYYVGAKVAIESATAGAGQIAHVTAFNAATRTCTVPTWATTPSGTIKYSIMLGLPECMARAVALRACLLIMRADKAIDRQMDDVAASYIEAYESGKAVLRGAKIGHIPQFRSVWDTGFRDFG